MQGYFWRIPHRYFSSSHLERQDRSVVVEKFKALAVPAFPLLLLFLTLSTVFLFDEQRGTFHRPGQYNNISADQLAIAANISPTYNFVRFFRQTMTAAGTLTYSELYHRYPIGGYLLIKATILPFDDDLSAGLYAIQFVMLIFFTMTATLAYFSFYRITSNRYIALTATLLTFSSSFSLYYNDMVSHEAGIDLFGVMLTFHGMVIFMQEGHFRQLLVKTCVALSLGWHVFALLLPFVGLSLAKGPAKARSFCFPPPRGAEWPAPPCPPSLPLLRRRSVQLGIGALIYGVTMLGFGFVQEYIALNAEKTLWELPSFEAMSQRLGWSEASIANARYVALPRLLKQQFDRIGGMLLPHTVSNVAGEMGDKIRNVPRSLLSLWGISGIVVSAVCLVGLAFVRQRILLGTLVLSGFCWSLGVRHSSVFHTYDGLFYVGIPLTFFCFVLRHVDRLFGSRVVVALSIVASLVFVLSSFQMSRVGLGIDAVERQRETMADFETIRQIMGEKVSFVLLNGLNRRHELIDRWIPFYLSGHTVLYPSDGVSSDFADFIISSLRHEHPSLLTPTNRRVFLYERTGYGEYVNQVIENAARRYSVRYDRYTFNLYIHDNMLAFVKSPQPGNKRNFVFQEDTPRDTGIPLLDRQVPGRHVDAPFFLHVIPVDSSDLPANRRRWGFDNLDFRFKGDGTQHGERLVVLSKLPDYCISHILTGQFASLADDGRLWEATISFDTASRNLSHPAHSVVVDSEFCDVTAASEL